MGQDNLITINNEKDNTLSFDVVFEGIESDRKNLRLVVALEKPNTYLMIEFADGANGSYKVTIPAKVLPVGTHNCRIEVIAGESANEHFFIPIEGSIKVTGAPKVSAKLKEEEKKTSVEVPQVPAVKISAPVIVAEEEPKAEEPVKEVEASSSVIIPEAPKDERVQKILSEMGFNTEKPTKSLKSYIKS